MLLVTFADSLLVQAPDTDAGRQWTAYYIRTLLRPDLSDKLLKNEGREQVDPEHYFDAVFGYLAQDRPGVPVPIGFERRKGEGWVRWNGDFWDRCSRVPARERIAAA